MVRVLVDRRVPNGGEAQSAGADMFGESSWIIDDSWNVGVLGGAWIFVLKILAQQLYDDFLHVGSSKASVVEFSIVHNNEGDRDEK